MTRISTVAELEDLGRTRLSKHFFMREMLYSEVSAIHGVPNIPEDPELAIHVGTQLCEKILEPLHERFGHVSIRSAYRSPTLNAFCHERFLAGEAGCWCTANEVNAARHIWDRPDDAGCLGATATVFIPAYLDHYERTRDYTPLAWWIRDHLPDYAEMYFFRPLCAFNIRWYEGATAKPIWFLDPPVRELLTSADDPEFARHHGESYEGAL